MLGRSGCDPASHMSQVVGYVTWTVLWSVVFPGVGVGVGVDGELFSVRVGGG